MFKTLRDINEAQLGKNVKPRVKVATKKELEFIERYKKIKRHRNN
jgi:hypothetical protein